MRVAKLRTGTVVGLALGALLIATPIAAQDAKANPVQWGDLRQGVQTAKANHRPLLFYVPGKVREDNSDLIQAEQDAFRDPRFVGLAVGRFVPVRVNRNTTNIKMLTELGAPAGYGFYLAVVTPDGKLIGTILPSQCADPTVLVGQLKQLGAHYNERVHKRVHAEKLRDPGASQEDVHATLRQIRETHNTAATDTVVAMLDQSGLNEPTKVEIYGTLAALSTQPAVRALLGQAVDDPKAERALHRCNPGGAEYLLAELDVAQPARLVAGYYAISRICKPREVKPREFWKSATPQEQQAEIARIHDEVFRVASRWRATHGHLH